jgi:hypothetical protein
MRSGSTRLRALAGAALFALALGACNFERNVSEDCWIDQQASADAQSYRAGLVARNLAKSEGAWSIAQQRIAKTSKDLRACLDGAPGSGRPATTAASPEGPASGHGA